MNIFSPEKESSRLKALYNYDILDTLPEEAYDDIARLASQICETPIALISLVDKDRQWFKSKVGLNADETSRDLAFCAHAILEPDELFIVTNAERDERFESNALVTSEPHIRFYAGAPLVTAGGEAIGTLCVIDRQPRILNEGQKQALRSLSRQAMAQLELRLKVKNLESGVAQRRQLEARLRESEQRFHAFMSNIPAVAYMKDEEGRYVYINERLEKFFDTRRDLLLGKTAFDWLPEEFACNVSENDKKVLAANESLEELEHFTSLEGKPTHWLSLKFPFTDLANRRFVGGISMDVTERIETREKLERSERLYRHLFENSKGLICTHDLEGNLLSINSTAITSLGYTADELIGTNLRRILKPEVRHLFDQYLARVRNYKMDEGLMLVQTKDGREKIWQYRNLFYKEAGANPFIIGHAQDITELHEAQKKLEYLSLTDELTGLYNRRGFLTMASQSAKIARRNDKECLLIFLDVDGLKRVNDTLGHETGSQLIKDAADILKSVLLRESDILARIGGDEFTVFIPDATAKDEIAIKIRLQKRIEAFNEENARPYKVSLSVGAVCFKPQGDDSLEDAMEKADQLMYVNKAAKKKQITSPALDAALQV